jgi:hypothetical protein
MHQRIRYRLSLVLTLALLLAPLSLQAATNKEQTDPAAMAIDLVVARPVGLVATVGGTAIFIVSSPFSLLGGNVDEAWDSLVLSPGRYTFSRPLGEFD